jgi:hypothetical protein
MEQSEVPVSEEELVELDRHVKMRLDELMNNSSTKIPYGSGPGLLDWAWGHVPGARERMEKAGLTITPRVQ